MSWRDEMQAASFRGRPFFVSEHDESGGRRVALHEYPYRDVPYAEDMGRLGGTFSVQAYVLGTNYMAARDALIEALDAGGPGELVHPWRGRKRVQVRTWRLRETVRNGGQATFTIEMVEAGQRRQPTASVDTAHQVNQAAGAVTAAATASFMDDYSTEGLPGWSLNRLAQALDTIARQLRTDSSALTASMASPGGLAGLLVIAASGVTREGELAARAFARAIALGASLPGVSFSTAFERRQARSQWALRLLARQAAVAAAAEQAARETSESQDDAQALLDAAVEALDTVAADSDAFGEPVAMPVFHALGDLRAHLVTHIRERALHLPRVRVYTPPTTTPALVLAQRLYGDALRDGEIVRRNRIRRPAFVPGGAPLEVLSDD